jgi:hypothetical protein
MPLALGYSRSKTGISKAELNRSKGVQKVKFPACPNSKSFPQNCSDIENIEKLRRPPKSERRTFYKFSDSEYCRKKYIPFVNPSRDSL